MRLRIGLCGLTCVALLCGCGDDDKAPTPPSKDAGDEMDAATTKPKDAGKPVRDSAVPPKVDSGSDAGKKDAEVDAGPIVFVDSGPGDVAIDAGPAPSTWKCAAALWADCHCDCGCGVADFDCTGQNCTERGCTLATCEACFTEKYSWKPCLPDPDPNDWKCSMSAQLDTLCDCGCGIPDPACGGSGCSEPG